VAPVDPAKARARLRGRAKDDPQGRVERSTQASERIATEIGVILYPGGDERVRDLHEQRSRPAKEQERLAIETARDGVAGQDPDVGHTPSVPLLRSFRFAFAGLSHLWETQRNFRIEVAVGLLALALGLLVHLERWEWVALLLTIALVLVLEAFNTTLENAVTLVSPNIDPRAKAAKDVAAAAVLIAAIVSVAIGILIFGSRLGLG
jgi:diacylglycerol kinase (ATP)